MTGPRRMLAGMTMITFVPSRANCPSIRPLRLCPIETMAVTATLEAGSYVLICNVWSEDEGEAHYAMGMRAAFTATE